MLLALSRIETGETTGAMERVDLVALISEAADAIASRAEQADITLVTDIDPEPLAVLAEKAKLQVVVESLLDNAVKFTPAGGTVTLTLTQAQRIASDAVATRQDASAPHRPDALITVADTGVGIPLAEQDAVFERFHRARNVVGLPGSGLGLAIVRATVTRLRGEVSFESDASGTRFAVRLPRA